MLTPLNAAALRTLIQNTLTPMGVYSLNAEELLMATCANESNFGEYRTQAPHGPARGIFQMEGEDFVDIWANYLKYHSTLASACEALNNGQSGTVEDLVNNDPYAIAMARVHYSRAPGALPDSADIEAIWAYYKAHYNTPQGAATHDTFMAKYKKFVLGQ
jgi:hypothetical protein